MKSYTATRNEAEVEAYYVAAPYTEGAPEYALEFTEYTEYEQDYVFYRETQWFFQSPNGELQFNTEDEAKEWLAANGYTSDY